MTAGTSARGIHREQLREIRLRNQLITGELGPPTGSRTVAQTVSRLLCVQAQDFGQALWALGLRTPDSSRPSVLAALDSGAVVRTWPMRGTLHFVAATDLRWMLALTAERSLRSAARRFAETGVDEATIALGTRVARAELAGGALTRAEFMRALQAAGLDTEGQRGYHLIFALAQAGLICWGPMRDTQQALVLVEEWIPDGATAGDGVEPGVALGELALRYFTGHGPATERDLAWWCKLPLTAIRSGIDRVRDQLSELRLGDTSYFVAADDPWARNGRAGLGGVSGGIHALPGFDEYLLGYQDRDAVLDPRDTEAVVPGKNGLFRPILVSGGEVVGVWRRSPDGTAADPGRPAMSVEPFRPLSEQEEHSLAAVAVRYSTFLGE